jgi:3-(3-hydroxy-phenyl)propionate hydroxylase
MGLPLTKVVLSSGLLESVEGAWQIAANEVAIARPLLTHRDQIMLVRPDRYCAAVFSPATLAKGLERYVALLAGDDALSSVAIAPAQASSSSR